MHTSMKSPCFTPWICNFICQLYLSTSGDNFLNKIKGVPGGKNRKVKEKQIMAQNVSESMSVSSYLRVSRGRGRWSHLKVQGDLLSVEWTCPPMKEGSRSQQTHKLPPPGDHSIQSQPTWPGGLTCLAASCASSWLVVKWWHLLKPYICSSSFTASLPPSLSLANKALPLQPCFGLWFSGELGQDIHKPAIQPVRVHLREILHVYTGRWGQRCYTARNSTKVRTT